LFFLPPQKEKPLLRCRFGLKTTAATEQKLAEAKLSVTLPDIRS
jgi:hypothetical protein